MWGYLCCLVVFCFFSVFSQTLLQEDFEYPADGSLTSHGWSAHASAATNPVKAVAPGLSYAGHPGSGIGNAARLVGSGEDINRSITGQTNAAVYVSFLIRVVEATTASDEYFLHLSSGTHAGKVFVRKAGDMIAFGLSKSSDAAVFTDAVYSLGTVYLIVLQYSHVSGSANDTARLFLSETGIPAMESDPILGPITSSGSEPSEINALALRQGLSAVPDIIVDAVRVSISWNDAGLPVTFSSFTADEINGDVVLRWRTESEAGNYGFEVERRMMEDGKWKMENGDESTRQRRNETASKADQPSAETKQRNRSQFTVHYSPWNTVGFVPGSGASSSPREYSFVDKPGHRGRYAYRIKQIDHSGAFTYTATLEVLTTSILPPNSILQTYPNPFNPTTTLRFFLQQAGHARIRVYDTSGKLIRSVAEKAFESGWHAVDFNAGGLASGTYLVRFESREQSSVQKIVLLR